MSTPEAVAACKAGSCAVQGFIAVLSRLGARLLSEWLGEVRTGRPAVATHFRAASCLCQEQIRSSGPQMGISSCFIQFVSISPSLLAP